MKDSDVLPVIGGFFRLYPPSSFERKYIFCIIFPRNVSGSGNALGIMLEQS